MPSGGLVTSLLEPVLLVDSRIPYGADVRRTANSQEHKGQRSEGCSRSSFCCRSRDSGPTVSDDGVKQSRLPPHGLGGI